MICNLPLNRNQAAANRVGRIVSGDIRAAAAFVADHLAAEEIVTASGNPS